MNVLFNTNVLIFSAKVLLFFEIYKRESFFENFLCCTWYYNLPSPFPAGEGKVDSALITFVQRISFWYIIFHSKKEYFIEKVCKTQLRVQIDSNKLFIIPDYWQTSLLKNDMSKCTNNSQTAVFALAKRGAGAKPLQEKTLSSWGASADRLAPKDLVPPQFTRAARCLYGVVWCA